MALASRNLFRGVCPGDDAGVFGGPKPQQLCCPSFERSGPNWVASVLLWERIRALFYGYHWSLCARCWRPSFTAMRACRPLLITDTS